MRTVEVEERLLLDLFECYRAVCVQMRMQMMVSVEDTAMVLRPVMCVTSSSAASPLMTEAG